MTTAPDRSARAGWGGRIDQRRAESDAPQLPAPDELRATAAMGHVRLDWTPVAGAAGYLIERTGSDGTAEIVRHGGSDVPAVPEPPFADTGLEAGTEYHYRVAAVGGNVDTSDAWSPAATAAPLEADAGADVETPEQVRFAVDAATVTGTLQRVWDMIGSERLTQLRFGDDGHGNDIGAEFAESLRRAHDDLGVRRVRAHAILHDDNAVVTRDAAGSLAVDFTVVDELYDQVLDLGLRPVVEVSFVPAALASDPEQTVFDYRAIISPPADWAEWYRVVHELAAHLVQRYGVDEVATWGFEVWNEPNLGVFWTGTQADYLRIYDEAARAVKDVDARLLVGGPSTAAAGWLETLAAHCADTGVPLDFVTTHTYGNLPLASRSILDRHGFGDRPIWWTEWGVSPTHFAGTNDTALGATFVLSGYQDVQHRIDALAYWVISDHFEELGRPPRLFHGGFGLLTVGNLRKTRYWAAHLAAHQGDHVLSGELSGDGADVLVRGWATRHDDGTVDVLVWNGTINVALAEGEPVLDRRVRITVAGLDPAGYDVRIARVDAGHSDISRRYTGDADWPDEAQWAQLRAADVLDEEPGDAVPAGADSAEFTVDLPMPGVARVRLVPGGGA